MIIKTNGILLKKENFREYDEKITFLTEKLGKIKTISYGSKSPRSRRRYYLSTHDWLKIEIDSKKNILRLVSLKTFKNNLFCHNTDDYLPFTRLLYLIHKILPYQHTDTLLYNGIYHYSLNNNLIKSPNKQLNYFVLLFGTLKNLGIFPYSQELLNSGNSQNLQIEEKEFYYSFYEKKFVTAGDKKTAPFFKNIFTPGFGSIDLLFLNLFYQIYRPNYQFIGLLKKEFTKYQREIQLGEMIRLGEKVCLEF